MPQSFQYAIQSVKGTHFTEALAGVAQAGVPPFAASALYSLPGLPPIASRRFLIRAIQVLTLQNFGPQFDFFRSAAGLTADPATDTLIGRWGFSTSMGTPIAGSPLFRYYNDQMAIPYQDDDTVNTVNPPTLHVILENIDTTAKVIGAGGAMTATFWVEPMQAW